MKDYKHIETEKNKILQKNTSDNQQPPPPAAYYRDPQTGLWKASATPTTQSEHKNPLLQPTVQKKETIASLIAKSAVRLAQSGIDTPRNDAELLLAFCLQTQLTGLYKVWNEPVPEEINQKYEIILEKRTQRMPVSYITGTVFFYGLEFIVDHRVLIPRPETELLVQKVIEYAKSWSSISKNLVFADVGTGSGVIAISSAYNLNFLKIYAIDISENILDLTRLNAARYNFESSINFLKGNLLEPLPEPAHLIVANLPYISNSEFLTLPPEITQHEPKEAFLAGEDGLWHIRHLLAMAPEYLLKGGKILLEIGEKQAAAVTSIAKEHFPLSLCETFKDLAGKDRVVVIHTN
ncbi:MAG: peptide chain release factor N(5)-glutamine methyltransferase [bacterium]